MDLLAGLVVPSAQCATPVVRTMSYPGRMPCSGKYDTETEPISLYSWTSVGHRSQVLGALAPQIVNSLEEIRIGR